MSHLLLALSLTAIPLSPLAQVAARNQPGFQSVQEKSDPAAVTLQATRESLPPPAEASPQELERTGDELRSKKAYGEAVEYYQAAMRKADSAALHNKMGIAYLQLLQLKPAEKQFNRAIRMDHHYAEALNNLGVVFYMKKKYGKAIGEYAKALRLNETSASFHSNLGMALFEKKEFEKASAEFVRALELDPQIFERQAAAGIAARMASPEDRARYAYTLARIYAGRGMYDRSLEYLKKAIEEGYSQIKDVYKDKVFAGLRKDPRFARVMARTEPLPN